MRNGGEMNLGEKAGGADQLREGDREETEVRCNI